MYFQGRQLMLRPVLTGVGLYKHNAQNNKRRLLLKSVPFEIGEADIKKFLEKTIGAVTSLFRFKPEKIGYFETVPKKRKMSTYSAMFENPVNHIFTKTTRCEIRKNVWITLEQFSLKKKERRYSKDQSTLLSNPRSCTKILPSEQGLAMTAADIKQGEETQRLVSKIQCRHIVRSRSSLGRLKCHASEEKRYKRETRSVKDKRNISTGYSRAVFIEELSGYCHHFKPGTKAYKLLRSECCEYLGTFELRNSWISQSNLKINKAKP